MVPSAAINARLKRLRLVSGKLVDSFFSGDYRSVFRGPGLEFHEARPYVPGDDVRFIDWNVSGRLNSPYCKVFREERELTLMMIYDVSASVRAGCGPGKALLAEEIFTLLGSAATAGGDRVGSLAFSDRIEWACRARRGEKYLLAQIKKAVSFTPAGKGSNVALALRTAREIMKRRGICVIISDFKADGYWRELSLLSRRHDVVAIRIEDELDVEFPKCGYLPLRDAETNARLTLFPASSSFRDEYAGYWNVMWSSWRINCLKRGVAPLVINVKEDPVARLLSFFKRRVDHA